MADNLATVIAASNTVLDQRLAADNAGAILLSDVAAVELVAQGTESAAIQSAIANPNELNTLVDNFTGSNLNNLVNGLPVASLDSGGIQKGDILTINAAKGLLTNDIEPNINDHLTVASVNGAAGNVAHSVQGQYGALTLNGDGSYSYTAKNGSLPSQERLRHFEPSERSNIIPLRRQREPEPESPPPRMFNDSRIQSLIDAAIEMTRAELDEYRKYVFDLLVELLAQFRDELLERYVAEDLGWRLPDSGFDRTASTSPSGKLTRCWLPSRESRTTTRSCGAIPATSPRCPRKGPLVMRTLPPRRSLGGGSGSSIIPFFSRFLSSSIT